MRADLDDFEQQAADYFAESAELDRLYREISYRYRADLPATDPLNAAVRIVLDAINGLNRPVPADLMARAA